MSDVTELPITKRKSRAPASNIEFSLIDDEIRYKKLAEKEAEYDAIWDKHWDTKRKSYDADPEFRKRVTNVIRAEQKPVREAMHELKFSELSKGNSIIKDPGKVVGSDYYRRVQASEHISNLAPDPEVLNKIIKRSKSGLKLIKPVLGGLAIAGALAAPDMAQAAVDFVVPGGVEAMGVSPEQSQLDKAYKNRIRQRQESLNTLLH